MLMICTVENVHLLKRLVAKSLPTRRGGASPFKSSHVTEAAAAGLGYGTNASLIAAIRDRVGGAFPLLGRIDGDAFVDRLAELAPFLRSAERPDEFFGGGNLISTAFESAWLCLPYASSATRQGDPNPTLVPEDHREGRLVAVGEALGRAHEALGNVAERLQVRLRHLGGTDFACDVASGPETDADGLVLGWARPRQLKTSIREGDGTAVSDLAGMLDWSLVANYRPEEFEMGMLGNSEPEFRASSADGDLVADVFPRAVRYVHKVGASELPAEFRPIGGAQRDALSRTASLAEVLAVVPSRWRGARPPAA